MFGGGFRVLRYDNLKAAVKQIMRGKRREQTTRFIAFRSHYLFDAEFCTPARGNEKGGVEQEGGRFRRRWWTPVPQYANLDELKEHLLEGCLEIGTLDRRLQRKRSCQAVFCVPTRVV